MERRRGCRLIDPELLGHEVGGVAVAVLAVATWNGETGPSNTLPPAPQATDVWVLVSHLR